MGLAAEAFERLYPFLVFLANTQGSTGSGKFAAHGVEIGRLQALNWRTVGQVIQGRQDGVQRGVWNLKFELDFLHKHHCLLHQAGAHDSDR